MAEKYGTADHHTSKTRYTHMYWKYSFWWRTLKQIAICRFSLQRATHVLEAKISCRWKTMKQTNQVLILDQLFAAVCMLNNFYWCTHVRTRHLGTWSGAPYAFMHQLHGVNSLPGFNSNKIRKVSNLTGHSVQSSRLKNCEPLHLSWVYGPTSLMRVA